MLTRETVMPGMLLRTNLNNIRLLPVETESGLDQQTIWSEEGDFLVVTDISSNQKVIHSGWHVAVTMLHLRTQRLCRLLFYPSTDFSHDFIYFDFVDFE